ncbi:MAG: prepilin peptidase, partial [Chitinivibrionales bacterium]|nr:prepilin peptidase [Chitinivibrionales bacterium]MBD3395449.1 prepilin peptidase [Chitinivibrionales bacterium]
LEHYIIPDAITLPGLALGFCMSFMPGGITPQMSFLGVAAGGGALFALGALGEFAFKKQDAMGGGDIKLMAFLGSIWGWKAALLGIAFGSILGVLASIVLIATHLLPKDRRIPFGPCLAAGVWASVLWGDQAVAAYLQCTEQLLFG